MTVETASHINQLNNALPSAGDSLTEGDDHLRLVKNVLVTDLANIGGPVTASHTELNYVTGVTSAIQTQLNNKVTAGLVLLSSAAPSSAATCDFTSNINSTYDEYELHLVNFVPANAGDVLWLRTSNDGSTWASSSGNYDYTNLRASGTSTTVTNGSTTATKLIISEATVLGTAPGICAVIKFFKPSLTSAYKKFTWTGHIEGSSSGTSTIFMGGGERTDNANAIVGVRALFSTGNIASGAAYLYGVRKT